MSVGQYRRRARECFEAAEKVANPGTKIWLVEMAQSWLVLAQQAEKNLDADPAKMIRSKMIRSKIRSMRRRSRTTSP